VAVIEPLGPDLTGRSIGGITRRSLEGPVQLILARALRLFPAGKRPVPVGKAPGRRVARAPGRGRIETSRWWCGVSICASLVPRCALLDEQWGRVGACSSSSPSPWARAYRDVRTLGVASRYALRSFLAARYSTNNGAPSAVVRRNRDVRWWCGVSICAPLVPRCALLDEQWTGGRVGT
jgi:hypothetical protein